MASVFIFNSAQADIISGSIDLALDTFYCHLVVLQPAPSVNQVSGLSLNAYTGYALVPATNVSYVSDIWKMDDFLFPTNTGTLENSVGYVICRQLGGSPASTDQPVVFGVHEQPAGTPVTIPIDENERIRVLIDQTSGIITTLGRHIFNSGSNTSDISDNNGLVYMLGTRAGAQAYVNPGTTSPTRRLISYAASSGSGSIGLNSSQSERLFDRDLVGSNAISISSASPFTYTIEFVDTLYQLDGALMAWSLRTNGIKNIKILCSRDVNPLTYDGVNDVANWDYEQDVVIPNTSSTIVHFTEVINAGSTFYKWFGIRVVSISGGTFNILELDFYNAALASVTNDLT